MTDNWLSSAGGRWVTEDECRFLREYAAKDPASCKRVCRLYLDGMRRWDSHIDEARVRNVAAGILLGGVVQ